MASLERRRSRSVLPGKRIATFALALSLLLALLSCRGQPSGDPPIRIVKDMTQQPKALAYSAAAQRAFNGARVGPAGVVAIEQPEDAAYSAYRSRASYVKQVPFDVDAAVLARGRQRFDIYCSPCHDEAGTGHGIISQRGFPSPVDLAAPNALRMADGQLFEVITQGIRNMPRPSEQLEVRDRWSIVAWVRVLQRSRNATLADVGTDRVSSILAEATEP